MHCLAILIELGTLEKSAQLCVVAKARRIVMFVHGRSFARSALRTVLLAE
jgi:hypothetical protein